jgi:hypothetical protein
MPIDTNTNHLGINAMDGHNDVEPALEAIDLLNGGDHTSRRLNLICLQVDASDHLEDDAVETRKRKIKKSAGKKISNSKLVRERQRNGSPVSNSSSLTSSTATMRSDQTISPEAKVQPIKQVERTQSRDSAANDSIRSEDVEHYERDRKRSSQDKIEGKTEPVPEEQSKVESENEETQETRQKYFCDIFWTPNATSSPQESAFSSDNKHSDQTKTNTTEFNANCSPSLEDNDDDDGCERYYNFAKGIRLGNNARLRAMIDILPADREEDIFHTFMCFKGSLFGVHHRPPLVFVMLTNRGIYLMNHVHESNLFTLEVKIGYDQIRHIILDECLQGLLFEATTKVHVEVCCASQEFTNEIIRCIGFACDNSNLSPPEILEDKTTKRIIIEKSLAKYLSLDMTEVKLKHAVTVFCGRAVDDSVNFDSLLESSELLTNFDEGSFGLKEGVLMYRFLSEDEELPNWVPGYFVLADGYIYCYSDATKNQLRFFGQLFNNHCKGCRRITDDDSRPHVIELKIVVDNVVQELNLAASNENETTEWMVNLLTSVNLESAENIGHFDGKNCMEKFCLLVMTEEAMFTLVRDVATNMFLVLDHVNICDVVTTMRSSRKSDSSFTFVVIDFESSQTNPREWTLYFVTPEEADRFLELLSRSWEELFQVSLQTIVLGERVRKPGKRNHTSCHDDDHSETSLAQQTLQRLSYWHRNAASVLQE